LIKVVSLNIAEDGEMLDLDPQTNELSDGARLRSVTISHNDLFIAVGSKDGTLRILSAKDFTIIKHIKERNKWIQDLKFSPNNLLLAVGSHDNYIDVYMVPEFRRKYALRKHSSFITHMDWSVDSCYLQSNCGAYELLYWDMTQGKQMTSGASQLRDESWNEFTCVLGWSVQGIWQKGMDGSDINMVSRSTTKVYGEYNIVATGDDRKAVTLYKYPCLKKGSKGIRGQGHSSFVTNVRFSRGDEYLYSTGGRDGSVFIWKIKK
jgi:microtubule-associated protein-like 6